MTDADVLAYADARPVEARLNLIMDLADRLSGYALGYDLIWDGVLAIRCDIASEQEPLGEPPSHGAPWHRAPAALNTSGERA